MQPTLIVTRPAPDGARFASHFPDMHVILSPLQRIVPRDVSCDAQGFVFTSAHGVAQAKRMGITSGPAWCVGDRTAQMARAVGFDAISAKGTAEDLLRLVLDSAPKMPLAHIRGKEARGDLAPRLRAAGVDCVDCIAYVQEAVSLSKEARTAIEGADCPIIPLFSPRAAKLLLDQVTLRDQVKLIAISQAVATVLGDRAVVADRPDGNAMIAATLKACATI